WVVLLQVFRVPSALIGTLVVRRARHLSIGQPHPRTRCVENLNRWRFRWGEWRRATWWHRADRVRKARGTTIAQPNPEQPRNLPPKRRKSCRAKASHWPSIPDQRASASGAYRSRAGSTPTHDRKPPPWLQIAEIPGSSERFAEV